MGSDELEPYEWYLKWLTEERQTDRQTETKTETDTKTETETVTEKDKHRGRDKSRETEAENSTFLAPRKLLFHPFLGSTTVPYEANFYLLPNGFV